MASPRAEGHARCHYAKATGVTHAQCWSHTRRGLFEALAAEPQAADQAHRMFAKIYEEEADIRQRALIGERKRLHRLADAKPLAPLTESV